MIANFALTSLVIRKDDRWNRNVLRILKQGEQYQFNGYGDECRSLERNFFAAGMTITPSLQRRIIFGFLENETDIHLRPLTKLQQDLYNQQDLV